MVAQIYEWWQINGIRDVKDYKQNSHKETTPYGYYCEY